MPRVRESRSTAQLSGEEKKKRRREQKKLSIRRARAKMDQAALEERRRKDREAYKRKKETGLIKTIKDFTPREYRQMRKLWREKAKKKREKEKSNRNALVFVEMNTPPSSPALSRSSSGRAVAARNRRRMKAENMFLKKKLIELESKIAKYRMRSVRMKKQNNVEKRKPSKIITKQKTRKAVRDFLLLDENSRSTSGKKETITRKKIKKQIRFLNDSLLNLHKSFVNNIGMNISYETFRRYRPFWILFPKVENRNTCLCIIHTNINLIVRALHSAKMISSASATDLIKAKSCNNILNMACLEQRCSTLCNDKEIPCNDFDDNDSITYERWVTKNVTVVIKGTSKQCKKTIKEKVQTTKKNLFARLNSALPIFMKHVAYMMHQMRTIQDIKENMLPDHGLLHIDFSENYSCKYNQEIQSAHFGGSKPQLSLHTSVYYSTNSDPPDNYVQTTSFCTVSENLRHDPILICVHLQAIKVKIRELSPYLRHLHILSDGPSTQYRNKSMFNLMATYLSKEFDIDTLTWHYSERGHGKGAPDGVGGCIKRIADYHVARGNDISNLEELMSCLTKNCKGIEVSKIDEQLIPEIQQILDKSILRPFRGTFELHQLAWSNREPAVIHARRLSCLVCAAHVSCPHYEIGKIQIQYDDGTKSPINPTTSPNSSPQPGPSNIPQNVSPGAPISPTTPDAMTESISPGFYDRLTPETSIDRNENMLPKRTRFVLDSEYSDSSLDILIKKKRPPPPIIWDDSDDENIF